MSYKNYNEYEQFLRSKNWLDMDRDSRFVNANHPYAILIGDGDGQITLRENAGVDNGQNGEEIFSFSSVKQLQEWFEDFIGE